MRTDEESPAANPYAVYIPGFGFESCDSMRLALAKVTQHLEVCRALDQWPEDIQRLGIYTIEPITPGEAFNPDAIARRAAAGAMGGYVPAFLVREVPGSRIERWPCTHCDGWNPDATAACDHCEGVGYLDQDGDPWAWGVETTFRVQYEINVPGEVVAEDDGLGFFHGCANALAIILVVGGVLGLLWWGLIVTGQAE